MIQVFFYNRFSFVQNDKLCKKYFEAFHKHHFFHQECLFNEYLWMYYNCCHWGKFLSINAILGIVFTHELLMIQSLQSRNPNVMQWLMWKKEVVEGSTQMLRMMKLLQQSWHTQSNYPSCFGDAVENWSVAAAMESFGMQVLTHNQSLYSFLMPHLLRTQNRQDDRLDSSSWHSPRCWIDYMLDWLGRHEHVLSI